MLHNYRMCDKYVEEISRRGKLYNFLTSHFSPKAEVQHLVMIYTILIQYATLLPYWYQEKS